MGPDAKIYIAGRRGLVGSALMRLLEGRGYNNLVKRTDPQEAHGCKSVNGIGMESIHSV